MKIVNNQNALLINKFSTALTQMGPNENNPSYSAKNGKIAGILSDYERTKSIN